MRVTLITGCSSGIGRETAVFLARQGYHVFAGIRNLAADGTDLVTLAQDEGLKLEPVALDVTDAEECKRVVETILTQMGRIDVLVNNAGLAAGGYLEEMPETAVRSLFEVNFFGAMRLMQLVTPSMREAQSGTIVNISSIMGRVARAGGSAYAASKFALEAASEALAQELRRFDVRVVLIEPGVVKTRIHEPKGKRAVDRPRSPYHEFDSRGERLFAALLRHPAYPEDVARIIHEAIETDSPKLRYLVGDDAAKWAAGRPRLTDEAWVDSGRKMDLEEYAAFYADAFGILI